MNKEVEIIENNIILPKIPFYGITGTISHIEDTIDCYYKVIYREDGSLNPLKLPIPKRRNKSLVLIEEDYYKEVEKYLTTVKDEYIKCKDSKCNTTLTNKQYILLFIITLLATIFSLPFFLATALMGLIFESISIISLYIVCDIHKKDVIKLKEYNDFIKEYQELEERLSIYNSDKEENASIELTREVEKPKIEKKSSFKYSRPKLLTKEAA